MSKPNSKAKQASGKQKNEDEDDDYSDQRPNIASPRQTPAAFVSSDDLINPLARTKLSDTQPSYSIPASSSSRYAGSNQGTALRYSHTPAGTANPYYTPPSSIGSTRSTLSAAYTTSTTSGAYSSQYSKAESSQDAVNRSRQGSTRDDGPVYKVRGKKFYEKLGRILVIMWSEPTASKESTRFISPGALGDPVHQKPRHFVVLKADSQHCLALAIHTHQGEGVARIPHKHQYSVIYTGSTPPAIRPQEAPRRGQRPMQPIPIRVLPDENTDRLDPMSRLNYGKIYTIEYRIPTKAFGLVHSDSRPALAQQYQAVQGIGMPSPPLSNGAAAVATRAPPAAATALSTDGDITARIQSLYATLIRDRGFTAEEARAVVAQAAIQMRGDRPANAAVAPRGRGAVVEDDGEDDEDEVDDDEDSGSGSDSDSE